MPTSTGPFYFAWVDATDNVWNDSFLRYDEYIFTALLEHAEGDIPTLTLDIKNPKIGLLNPSRKVWCWFAWDDGSTIHHLFFGRLVGIPSNMLEMVVTIKFIGKPNDYIQQKQLEAERLKAIPRFYDPIFLSLEKRDDPDAILEAYSKLYHVSRPDMVVTSSNNLNGEDGTVTFNANDAFRDSVKVQLLQPPLAAVSVNAGVSWKQEWIGEIQLTPAIYTSYEKNLTGKWPAPLSDLGGGWTVAYSMAHEIPSDASAKGDDNFSWSWQNNEKTHNDGDVMSITIQSNIGATPTGGKTILTQIGVVDPFAVDADGDPAPLNIPAITTYLKPLIDSTVRFGGMMILRYQASRQRSERINFILEADVQQIITDPLVTQDTEALTIEGQDVGLPVLDLDNWSTVAGSFVDFGQLIFPDNPTLPGQSSTQICSSAGTTGTVEPVFSNVPGATTIDGSAVWTSLGNTQPAETAPDWSPYAIQPSGAIILPRQPIATPWGWLAVQGLIADPPQGFSVGIGQVILATNGFYHYCIKGGTTGINAPFWASSPGSQVSDNEVVWVCIGSQLPYGSIYFIATSDSGSQTGQYLPDFGNHSTKGDVVFDGSVTWTCIGEADIPIGGFPGMTPRRSYWPTNRGIRSLRYLLMRARARLRQRARAIEVEWDCRYSAAIALSCRMNAILFDNRLPGGNAAGKIIAYSALADGDRGMLIGHVKIGCTVGTNTAVVIEAGAPVYVVDGYFEAGQVQQWIGRMEPIDDDLGFTYPLDNPYDDGLTFPLTDDQAIIDSEFNGAATGPVVQAVNAALALTLAQAQLPGGGDPTAIFNAREAMNKQLSDNLASAISQFPVWYRLALVNLQNGPFDGYYVITSTKLRLPKTIDLEAAST